MGNGEPAFHPCSPAFRGQRFFLPRRARMDTDKTREPGANPWSFFLVPIQRWGEGRPAGVGQVLKWEMGNLLFIRVLLPSVVRDFFYHGEHGWTRIRPESRVPIRGHFFWCRSKGGVRNVPLGWAKFLNGKWGTCFSSVFSCLPWSEI